MYRPTIGLEIHAELATKTKMFCACANDPDETRPNVNVCPVCLAHPGTLPVANREAVRHVLRIGAALGGTLADYSEFDRKSYFYPDIPKGYQISQYAFPLVVGGSLAGVTLTRVHLEEDTARSIHSTEKSLVDFNRAGIPLMELVTEPVLPDALSAGRFARELQLLLRTLRASEANLEKGEMRIEANVSVQKNAGSKQQANNSLGTKVEIKNLNSFRSVERAIAYEIDRQITLLEESKEIAQETRGWNEEKQETFHQRFKEKSADYRYFPEPDLPKLFLSDVSEYTLEALRASLPELPLERRERYKRDFALKESDIAYLSGTPERAAFFDAVAREFAQESDKEAIRLAANYIVSDIAGMFAKSGTEDFNSMDTVAFAKLIKLTRDEKLSSRGAKDTLAILFAEGGDPETIAKARNLIQVHDKAKLGAIADAVIAREAKAVEEYRSGKQTSLQYLIGQAMRDSYGTGNPSVLKALIEERLKKTVHGKQNASE